MNDTFQERLLVGGIPTGHLKVARSRAQSDGLEQSLRISLGGNSYTSKSVRCKVLLELFHRSVPKEQEIVALGRHYLMSVTLCAFDTLFYVPPGTWAPQFKSIGSDDI